MIYNNLQLESRLTEILPLNPCTGDKLHISRVITDISQVRQDEIIVHPSVEVEPTFADVDGKLPSKDEMSMYRWYEAHNWKLFFEATHGSEFSRGLVIMLAYYRDVEYIYRAMVPWVGNGAFWNISPQYLLMDLEAGPVVFEMAKGFIIYARYRLGYKMYIEEAFYFDEGGNFIPYIYYTGSRRLDYIPIYVDFDINGPSDDSAVVYDPRALRAWNQAVCEFGYAETATGIPASDDLDHRLMNVLLFNQESGLAWVQTYLNVRDNPSQYVALWRTYDVMRHPRMNIAGGNIVRKDIVYVYVIRRAQTGLYGPRFIMRRELEKTWEQTLV
ncbi:MAG: hypothetical protein HPY71_00990 [Firmicutes bacterium]|nr:hypothetical protein [Bacillota bacterium]